MGLENEIEKKIKESGNKPIKPKKRTKIVQDANGRLREFETTPEQDELDKARDAAAEKYFKDKPKTQKKKAGGKIQKMKRGGMVKKCCDGIAKRGKTKGRMV